MKRTMTWLLALAVAAPLFGQTTTTTKTTTTTVKHGTAARTAQGSMDRRMRVYNDVARLASLLHDAQTTATVQAGVWKTIGNEANVLTNRIYANTAGAPEARAAARDLRLHVREMRNAAMKGDADGARDHAKQALPAAWKLIDWSTPAQKES